MWILLAFFARAWYAPRQFYVRNLSRGKTNVTKEANIEAMKERFGLSTLHSSISLQKNISKRAAVQFPELSAHLGHPRRQQGDFSRRGQPFAPRSKVRATPRRIVENSESNRLHLVENTSGKSARVLRLGVMLGNARVVRCDKKGFHEVGNKSATWRHNHLKNEFEVHRLPTASVDKTTCFLDSRRCWKRVHARDAPLHRILFMGVMKWSSVNVQQVLGSSTRMTRKVRMEAGTAKRGIFLSFTQDLDSSNPSNDVSSRTASKNRKGVTPTSTSTRAISPST